MTIKSGAPDRIYLQTNGSYIDGAEITWCSEQICTDDDVYIHESVVEGFGRPIGQALSNTEILLFVLGYQGGTLTQLYMELEVSSSDILHADNTKMHDLCRLSSNLRLRQDGLPYTNQAQPQDRGVAVYFTYKGRQMCFACDRWDKIQDNIYAIALTVEALRGIGRWGSGDMVEQAFTGFAALPDPMNPYKIVGVPVGSPWQDITRAYREKAKMLHVDAGGSHSAMVELNEAYAKLKEKYKDVA